MTDNKQYPELPDFEEVEQHIYGTSRGYIPRGMLEPIHELMRAYADATCAMRLGTPLIDEAMEADAIATSVCRAVSELPDRNSPQDWPEAMLVTGDELHQIVGDSVIDRQQRNRLAEPVAWRHSRTLGLFDIEEDVPLADGDEWAEPLYLHPPEAPASQDAEDAARSEVRVRWALSILQTGELPEGVEK